MKLSKLHTKHHILLSDDKLILAYQRLENLLHIAESKTLSEIAIQKINTKLELLNTTTKINDALYRLANLIENEIITILEEDLKIVPIGYYSKKWIAIGMSAFGIPLGLIIGLLSKNMGMLAVGLPIGLGIGTIIGKTKDARAASLGLQYNINTN